MDTHVIWGHTDDDECQERGVLSSLETVKWALVRRCGGDSDDEDLCSIPWQMWPSSTVVEEERRQEAVIVACTVRKEMREGSVSGKQAALFRTQDRTVWVDGGFPLPAALQMPGLRLRVVPGLQMASLSSPTPAQALRFGVFCGDGKVWAFRGLGGVCRERVRGETQQR